MAKLIITHADKAPVHVHIGTERVFIGRGEHCQARLDDPAVSKEHAAIQAVGNDDILEDLGSTNGTLVNGQRLRESYVLQNRDEIRIGGYTLQYVSQRAQKHMDYDKTLMFAGGAETLAADAEAADVGAVNIARVARAARPLGGLRGIDGAAAGQSIDLNQVVRRVGVPGHQTAAILRRPHGYYLMHVEGGASARVNGVAIGQEWRPLADGDELDIAGSRYRFHLFPA